MRTTVDIADELMRRARKKAADEGVPLRRILEDALRSYLKGPGRTGGRYKLRWRPQKGRLRPGVNIDDRKALMDFMDEES